MLQLKIGYSYRFNPPGRNRIYHVRSIFDGMVAYAFWSKEKQMWRYYVDSISLWEDQFAMGWIAETGKTNNGLPELEGAESGPEELGR
jgi:hypothetical protein